MNPRAVAALDIATESLLCLLAFALPLAFHLWTFDAALVKEAALLSAACALVALNLLRALETGRFEVPSPRLWLVAWGKILLLWALLSVAWSPAPEAALPGALRLAAFLALFVLVLAGPASYAFAARMSDWTLGAAAAAAAYAVLQALGADPLPWKGAFNDQAFSTLARPDLLGAFLGTAFPLSVARLLDRDRAPSGRLAAASAGVLCVAGISASRSPAGLVALCASSLAWAVIATAFCRDPESRYAGLGAAATAAAVLCAMIAPGDADMEGRLLALTVSRDGLLSIAPEEGMAGLLAAGGLVAAVLAVSAPDIARRLKEGAEREGALMAGLWAAALGLAAAGVVAPVLSAPAPGVHLWLIAGCLAGMALERGSATVRVLPVAAPPAARRALAAPVAAAMAAALVWPLVQLKSDAELNRGLYHARRGGWDAAIESFGRVSRWHSRGAQARYLAGNALLTRGGPGDLEAALARYRESDSIDPRNARSRFQKGVVLSRLGRWSDAADSLKESLRLDPRFAPSYAELAEVSLVLHRPDEALAAATRLVGLDPQNPAYWRFLAERYQDLKRPRVARRMLQKAESVPEVAGGGQNRPPY